MTERRIRHGYLELRGTSAVPGGFRSSLGHLESRARLSELARFLRVGVVVGALLGACGETGSPGLDRTPADLILTNGVVVTVDPALARAQALAVRGDRILDVGTSEEMAKHVGPDTEVIDLDGRTAIPGLIEGHGHYTSFGRALSTLDLRDEPSFAAMVKRVEAATRDLPAGEWILGHSWHQDKWTSREERLIEGLPLHDALSAATPDHPVMLIHTSGHGVFVNQHAMDLVGVDATTAAPDGGEIVRDEQGRATGMMRESAQEIFRSAYEEQQAQRPAEEVEAELRRWVVLAGEEALRHGITSFQDLGTTFDEVDVIEEMATEGALPVRLYMALDESASDMAGRLAEYRMVGHADHFLTVRAIGEKVLDGALGTHGGWLLEPYADLPRSSGLNVVPVAEIEASAQLALEHDYQMAIQGIGDRAYRELLDVYERAFEGRPQGDHRDHRWRIEHAQVVHPDDVQRTVELGVIPAVQGIFACSDGPWVGERLGEQRTRERGYIFNSLAEAGAVPTNGTDPPVDDIDPIASFHCSVTRLLPDGTTFQPQEVYSRERALYSYTMGNAIAAFEEDVKGSLTPGKLADITVLSQDLLTVADERILDTEIVMTIVGGRVRYREGEILD